MYDTALGVDVLERDGFRSLEGRTVGLITNHTGLNRQGRATVDLLNEARNVRLDRLFGPEHGIRGLVEEDVPDGRDEATGLPVYSLYGQRLRPEREHLEGLDTIVFDIQDVGVRFYTYSTTLCQCLEAAAESGVRMVVLDRPNPIGSAVEGPVLELDQPSFVAWYQYPLRHGLTLGELARLYRADRELELDLEVIQVERWDRNRLWDSTGLTWTNPSPNMRSLTQALLYPGVGMLEFTNFSVGRGTDTPFELFGAPWLDAPGVARALNTRGLPGVCFVPIRFTPTRSRFEGELCSGVNIVITERSEFRAVRTGLAIAETLLALHPKQWEPAAVVRLLANRTAFEALKTGAKAEELEASWEADHEAYRERRKPYLLY